MNPQEVIALLQAEPFHPFRVHMSGGKSFDVDHPDQVLVTRSKLLIGVRPEGRLVDHIEHCALIHVTRLEEKAAGKSR